MRLKLQKQIIETQSEGSVIFEVVFEHSLRKQAELSDVIPLSSKLGGTAFCEPQD